MDRVEQCNDVEEEDKPLFCLVNKKIEMVLGFVLGLAVDVTWWTIKTTTSTVYYYAYGRRQQAVLKEAENEKELQKQREIEALRLEVDELKRAIAQRNIEIKR